MFSMYIMYPPAIVSKLKKKDEVKKNPLSICAATEMLLKLCNVEVNMKVMVDDDVCESKRSSIKKKECSGAETYSY